MTTHECNDCRTAQQLNIEQIDRYLKSELDAEEFINQPYEEEMSTLMNRLTRKCKLRQQSDVMFPSPK